MPLYRSTPRVPISAVPGSLMSVLCEVRQTIAAQQNSMTTLQSDMAKLSVRGPGGSFSTTRGAHAPAADWLLQHFSAMTFNITKKPLPVMQGEPYCIPLLPGGTSHACQTPASIPKHCEDEIRAQIDKDIKRSVIQPIPAGEPTEWCVRTGVVALKCGQPRRTVHYRQLNVACL